MEIQSLFNMTFYFYQIISRYFN